MHAGLLSRRRIAALPGRGDSPARLRSQPSPGSTRFRRSTGDDLILGVGLSSAGAAVADCQCVLPITFFAGEVVAAAASMLAEPLDPKRPLHYKVAAYPLAAPSVVSDDGWGVSLIESDPVCGERSLSAISAPPSSSANL